MRDEQKMSCSHGRKPGVALDPNYRSARDTVDNINREALAVMGSGVAFASAATRSPSRASTACRLTASGIARGCGRSSRCPRDRPWLLQDGRGPFETRY